MEINQIKNDKEISDRSLISWSASDCTSFDTSLIHNEFISNVSCSDLVEHDIMDLFDVSRNESSMAFKSLDDVPDYTSPSPPITADASETPCDD